jgi:hypothetical protein
MAETSRHVYVFVDSISQHDINVQIRLKARVRPGREPRRYRSIYQYFTDVSRDQSRWSGRVLATQQASRDAREGQRGDQ